MVSSNSAGYYMVAEVNSWKMIKGIQELDAKIKELEAKASASAEGSYGTGTYNISSIFASIIDMFKSSYEIIFEKGLIKVAKLVVNREFCMDDVCVTKDQFRTLLEKNGIIGGTPIPTPEPVFEVEPLADQGSTSGESSPTPEPSPTPSPTPEPAL